MNPVEKAIIIKTLTTVSDYLRWTLTQLSSAGVTCGHGYGDAWDESLALVLNALKLPWDLNPALLQATLLEDERSFIVDMVCCRTIDRIPTAYLINKAWFCGLEFYVDERVLIPRSPIGELIDSRFEGIIADAENVRKILDVCTGSGCIAIALANAFEAAEVHATDINADALAVAEGNVHFHHLNDRVNLFEGNLLEPVIDEEYDLIVSNPPYVDAEDMSTLAPEFLHEPVLGLSGGQDGLNLVHAMLPQVARCLTVEGVFLCEVGNSAEAFEHAYPALAVVWLEFERGGSGVFMVNGRDLKTYFGVPCE